MGRQDYLIGMRQRMADLDFQIRQARGKMAGGALTDRQRVELAGNLEEMERRRAQMAERLARLGEQPDGTWTRARAEVEEEWDALVQDFEERIGRLM